MRFVFVLLYIMCLIICIAFGTNECQGRWIESSFFKNIIIKHTKFYQMFTMEPVILVEKLDFRFWQMLWPPHSWKKQRIFDSISEKLVASFRQVLCYIHSSRCRMLIDCTVLCMYVHGTWEEINWINRTDHDPNHYFEFFLIPVIYLRVFGSGRYF